MKQLLFNLNSMNPLYHTKEKSNFIIRYHISDSPIAQPVKNPCAVAWDWNAGSILELGRSPGGGNGHPLHYSCLENPMDREAWWATVQRITKNQRGLSYWTPCISLILMSVGFIRKGTYNHLERSFFQLPKTHQNPGQWPLPPGRLVLGSPIPISSKGSRSGSYSVLKTFTLLVGTLTSW